MPETVLFVETPDERLNRVGSMQPISNYSLFGKTPTESVVYPSQEFVELARFQIVNQVLSDEDGLGYKYENLVPEV